MNIQSINIPFPDFKLQEIIDPEQFDLNNKSVVDKIAEILVVLNQITESVTNGASGADKISLTAITPFISTKLQSFLEELIDRLSSNTSGASGADFISSMPINGVNGLTVLAQLQSLKTLFDNLQTQVTNNFNALNTHKTSGDHDARYYQKSETYSNQQTYSKQEVNTIASLKISQIIDGGSFLDTYGSQSGVVDGGVF